MGLSNAFATALSGLSVTSRRAQVVSSNIANATTPGYARRVLDSTSRQVGDTAQGVQVRGILRQTDPVMLADCRAARATAAAKDVAADFLARAEAAMGSPDDAQSVTGGVAALQSALTVAAAQPQSDAALGQVAFAARALTDRLRAGSDTVQTARATADAEMGRQVAQVNAALSQIAALNGAVATYQATGRDTATLLDQRQALVDSIAPIIPLREAQRDHGQIALYSTGGAVLLEGKPAPILFAPAGIITADMTLASGALSGLTLAGRPLAGAGALGGGSLGALMALRDDTAPDVQAQLDAIARDLLARSAGQGPGDATLIDPAPAADDRGLSARLTLNPLADPQAGGALWRLRDGMAATAPTDRGDPTRLTAWNDALDRLATPTSGPFQTGARSLATLSADVLADLSTRRVQAFTEQTYANARSDALHQMAAEDGVDSDQEMQDLLLVEQAFAANAKVISTTEAMLQKLMEI